MSNKSQLVSRYVVGVIVAAIPGMLLINSLGELWMCILPFINLVISFFVSLWVNSKQNILLRIMGTLVIFLLSFTLTLVTILIFTI